MTSLQILPHSLQTRNPRLLPNSRFPLEGSVHRIARSSIISRSPSSEIATKKSLKNQTSFILCRRSEYFEPQRFDSSRPSYDRPGGSGGGEGGDFQTRVFVGHSVYKGKAALTVEPRGPEFAPLESGSFKVAKDGFVLLQFAPASGLRQYDWSRKQVFSLSVVEIGTLMSLGPKESCEFFHDPFKGKSDEGKVRKVLKVEPLADGTGHFFNLSVQNKLLNMDESIYIPITKAEFAILNSVFNFILPHLIGWHAYATSIKPGGASRVNNTGSPVDYEWNR
uniref:Uncharacterized protein n=1 Tax=Kalanchoe fedtschenkoi TaxID=63787 RepID=A0A7N0V593_KALFE